MGFFIDILSSILDEIWYLNNEYQTNLVTLFRWPTDTYNDHNIDSGQLKYGIQGRHIPKCAWWNVNCLSPERFHICAVKPWYKHDHNDRWLLLCFVVSTLYDSHCCRSVTLTPLYQKIQKINIATIFCTHF